MNTMKNIILATDGSCSGNPGPGGWAAILRFGEHEKELVGNSKWTTNNIMELQPVVESVKALKQPCKITLNSDSTYIVNGVNTLTEKKNCGWKTKTGAKIKNFDMWTYLDSLIEQGGHEITAVHVQGHSGNPDNERCDMLAREQTELAKKG